MTQAMAGMLGNPIRLSPLVGLAADVDGDNLSVMLAGPQLRKSLTEHANIDALAAYEDYSIRSQVLKAKGAGDQITLDRVQAAAVKIGVTEGPRVGMLSAALQRYRAGIYAGLGGLSTQESMNALGLLEWLEQTPISAKHVARGQELTMFELMDDIQKSLNRKSAAGITAAVETVLENAKSPARALLEEGITVSMEDAGGVTTRFIPSIDLQASAENIVRARQALEASAIGNMNADRLRRVLMGKAQPSVSEARALMQSGTLELSPFAPFFQTEAPSAFAELATRATTMKNRIGAAGRSMLEHAKPLGLGIGVALGVAAVLSEPPRILPPGANIPPPMPQTGTGGAEIGTDLHPDGHVRGAPTASNPVDAGGAAMIRQPSGDDYLVNVHGVSDSVVDLDGLTEQLRQATGGRTRVNSTIRDLRGSLTPQRLSSILRDE
jgi:hypothetical protein